MHEYENIAQMVLDFVLWFMLGAISFYLFQAVVDYFNGPKD